MILSIIDSIGFSKDACLQGHFIGLSSGKLLLQTSDKGLSVRQGLVIGLELSSCCGKGVGEGVD